MMCVCFPKTKQKKTKLDLSLSLRLIQFIFLCQTFHFAAERNEKDLLLFVEDCVTAHWNADTMQK